MIRLVCISCSKELTIDDAFAGGVCRCQYCGTIQTVPAKGAAPKLVAGAATSGSGMKSLFENKARPNISPGSGLDELADVIASSGLSDRGLRSKKGSPSKARQDLMVLLAASAVVIVLLSGIVAYLILNRAGAKTSVTNATSTPVNVASSLSAVDPAVKPSSANFCGVSIDHATIVYLIDNGSSSDTVLDGVKTVVFKSIESLGADKHFQVMFWNPNSPSYPSDHSTAIAAKDNISLVEENLRDVAAMGSTEPTEMLKNAIQVNPDEIILITAKAGNLDDSLVDEVMTIRGSSKISIDCFAINGNPGDTVLSQIAAKTGGKFATISETQLKAFAY